MKLYFRLLSRAITPVVLAAACLAGTSAVAMHQRDEPQARTSRPSTSSSTLPPSRATSAPRHSSPRRAPIAAPDPASIIARASVPTRAQSSTTAQDLTVDSHSLSKIFPNFNLANFFSEIENLGLSSAYDTIERRVNCEVKSATDSLKAQRTRLQSQEADLTTTIQGYMKRLTEEEAALTQLLDSNASQAEKAIQAYEMGIAEVEKLSALQTKNKAEIAKLRVEELRLRKLGVHATTAISNELTRLRREAGPAAPSEIVRTPTVLVGSHRPTTPQALQPRVTPPSLENAEAAKVNKEMTKVPGFEAVLTLSSQIMSIKNWTTMPDHGATRARMQKKDTDRAIARAAWDFRTFSEQEIISAFDQYFDRARAHENSTREKNSLFNSVLDAQKKRRQDARTLFQQLAQIKKSALPTDLLELAQQYRLPEFLDSEDGVNTGFRTGLLENDIRIRCTPALKTLMIYRNYVTRTFEWLPSADQVRHHHIIETLNQMAEEEKNRTRQLPMPAPYPLGNPANVGGGGGGGAQRSAPQSPAAAPAPAPAQRSAPRNPFNDITSSLS